MENVDIALLAELFGGYEDNMQDLAFALHLDGEFSSDAPEVNEPKKLAERIIDILSKDNEDFPKKSKINKYLAIAKMALLAVEDLRN